MPAVIRIVGFAGDYPCPDAGKFLESMDFEANGGRGHFKSTWKLADAMKFHDKASAFLFWRKQSKTVPYRPTDGKPNRPLTVIHAEIVETE